MPPSPRQRETLEFVTRYIHEHGLGPSRAEIAEALGMADKSNANVHLAALERKGWVRLRVNSPRYIRLLHDTAPVVATGPVTEDDETLAYDRIVDQVPWAIAEWFRPRAEFFVELHDESMQGAGLRTGDLIGVSRCEGTEITGAIAVVRRQNEVVLRRLRRIDERRIAVLRETTSTGDVEQIVNLGKDEVRIEGRMVGALVGGRPEPEDVKEKGTMPDGARGRCGARQLSRSETAGERRRAGQGGEDRA